MTGLAAGVAPALAPIPLQFGGGGILYWALIFFVLAIVAWVLGARGIAGLTMEVARILVLIFIVLAIISLILQFLG